MHIPRYRRPTRWGWHRSRRSVLPKHGRVGAGSFERRCLGLSRGKRALTVLQKDSQDVEETISRASAVPLSTRTRGRGGLGRRQRLDNTVSFSCLPCSPDWILDCIGPENDLEPLFKSTCVMRSNKPEELPPRRERDRSDVVM